MKCISYYIGLFLIGGFLAFSPKFGLAQDERPHATNIRLDVHDDMLIIKYDLLGTQANKAHCIEVFFSDINYNNRIFPTDIIGDIGCDVTPGLDKMVVWNIISDKQIIDIPIQCNIIVDGILGDGKTGGPYNAAFSVLVPGLGDYMVADPKYMTIKPWVKTTFVVGTVGMGVISAQNRYREQRYIEGHWETFHNYHTGTTDLKWIPGRYVNAGTHYFLFKDDAEILIAAGTVVWLADIVWVMNKGRKNVKAMGISTSRNKVLLTPMLNAGPDYLGLGISLNL